MRLAASIEVHFGHRIVVKEAHISLSKSKLMSFWTLTVSLVACLVQHWRLNGIAFCAVATKPFERLVFKRVHVINL